MNTINVAGQMANWPTPMASDGNAGGIPDNIIVARNGMPKKVAKQGVVVSIGLARLSVMWPTPTASDHRGPSAQEGLIRRDGKSRLDQLPNAAVYLPPLQGIQLGEKSSLKTPGGRRHLNPLFAAWLMGWPLTWVIAEPHASGPLVTASYRRKLALLLSSLLKDPDC